MIGDNDLDLLLPQQNQPVTWGWATVTGVSPVRVRRDGEDDPLVVDPDMLVSGVWTNDRVWCQFIGRRVIVHGRAGGPARLRPSSTADVTLTSEDHAFQVGPTDGSNIAQDSNEIQARNNGAPSRLVLNAEGGPVRVGSNAGADLEVNGDVTSSKVRLTSTADASTSSTAHGLQIGPSNGLNLAMDTNEIVVRSNGSPANLNLAENLRVTLPVPDHDHAAARVDWVKEQNILWTGGFYMHGTQSITPSETLLSQKNGWILVWSAYSGGTLDYEWSYHVVPKLHASFANGRGVNMSMGDVSVGMIQKYLYISNTTISGYADNSASPSNQRVLRYVIGF